MKFLIESKLDIFHLAYIRHKVEIENNRLPSKMERNDTVQEGLHEFRPTDFSARTFGPVPNSDDFSVRDESPKVISYQILI